MGSATAYHLARLDPSLRVVVVEKDPTYHYSSTLRSDGNVRIQFNLAENIRISRYAFEVLETFADDMAVGEFCPDPAPRHQGNLFLASESDEAAARQGMERQLALGCEVEWLDADEVARRYPPYAGSGYTGGTFSQIDGSVDPNAVLHGYRRKAISLGVEYVTAEVVELLAEGAAMTGVGLANGTRIEGPIVMNAAGAWCAELAATVGVELPVLPIMRSVYVVDTPIRGSLPSVFLPNGLYVIPEHQGSFAVGGDTSETSDDAIIGDHDVDAWVAGGGIAYTMDAWTFGAQYSHQDADDDGDDGVDFKMDRAVLTANYALGPGIDLDGQVGYTWVDTSPESDDGVDDYDALEIGIGTAITF